MTRAEHVADWMDCAAGITLLYSVERGLDDFCARLRAAMESENLDEICHVTALMLLYIEHPSYSHERWSKANADYHREFREECLAKEKKAEAAK